MAFPCVERQLFRFERFSVVDDDRPPGISVGRRFYSIVSADSPRLSVV
jgi:hypothetical protein